MSYLPSGQATTYSFAGNGQALNKLYDANYRATDIEGGALTLHFKLDALGDIIAEGNAVGVPTPNESYLYDPLDRLLQVDGATGAAWQRYTYNKTGDRLSKVMAGAGTDTYSYTSNTHHLIGITGYDVSKRTMDANGNTTAFQANGWNYGLGYNDANRLTAVQQNGTTVATYGLNGIGERVTKTLSGRTQSYVYDEAGKLLGEYATGQSRDYVWADGTLVAILDNPAQGGGTIHYVYTDNLGSPRAVTTPTGTLVWDWPYNKNPFGEAQASGNGYTLNLRYLGQYYDAETELNYNYHRDYQPGMGRYIESDPAGLAAGPATYSYVGSNPLGLVDPAGLVEWKGTFHMGAVIIGAGAAGGTFNLKSECVDGKQVSAHVLYVAGGAGIGPKYIPGGGSGGSISLHDSSQEPNAKNLQGPAGYLDIGVTVGKISIGHGRFRLGHAYSDSISSGGLDIGASVTLGSSTVLSQSTTKCDCSGGSP